MILTPQLPAIDCPAPPRPAALIITHMYPRLMRTLPRGTSTHCEQARAAVMQKIRATEGVRRHRQEGTVSETAKHLNS